MPDHHRKFRSLAIFCKVVDNFGDIGICWRLARQLQEEHGLVVTLWVDDLPSFQRLCPQVDLVSGVQQIANVTVRHWHDQGKNFSCADIAEIVVEFFGCDIPTDYIAAMARCIPAPVWINLEGLSAEAWVEGCHTLPSPHPQLPLIKYFFFPGFTARTGGLLQEAALRAQRQQYQSEPAGQTDLLRHCGVTPAEILTYKVSMFCYPQAPLAMLFAAWASASAPVICLVPDGVASDAVAAFLAAPPAVGAARTRGALTVRVLPFLPQADYDRLLWSCDTNFVRGEDSFVRAQWAGKPFVWHIYPQDKNLHHVKLRAFLDRYALHAPSLRALWLHWNAVEAQPERRAPDWQVSWRDFQCDAPAHTKLADDWQWQMGGNGDLASNLLQFAASLGTGG